VPCAQARRQAAGAGIFQGGASPLEKVYDWYSFKVLPAWASWWRATTPATATWPNPSACTRARGAQGHDEKKAGFGHVDYHNLTGGVVALHVGIKC
jgi:demethylmenaquinone methyltransferase/2-methoxy-6-polyprenyl-1,4-benzoquinol methylase